MTRSRIAFPNRISPDAIPLEVEETPDASNRSAIDTDRRPNGTFGPGNLAGRKRQDLDSVLRLVASPWKLAECLMELALAPGPDQLKAISYVYDRLAGRPRQSLTVSADDSAGVIAMRQLYAAISGTEYVPPTEVDADYQVLPAGSAVSATSAASDS